MSTKKFILKTDFMIHNSRFFAVYRTYYLNKKSFLTILQNIKCLKLFVFVWFLGFYKFFISYSAGWQSTLTHCHGYSLPIPIRINAFYSIVDPMFTGKIFANLYIDCHKPDSHQSNENSDFIEHICLFAQV